MASASADSIFSVYILSARMLALRRAFDRRQRAGAGAHAGKAAAWTAARRPAELVYTEQVGSEAAAVRRDRQLKRWTHAKK
jgi:predicted GIY-YIG superfamily endonuclease